MGFLETQNMLHVLKSMLIVETLISAFLYIFIGRPRVVTKSAYSLRHARLSVLLSAYTSTAHIGRISAKIDIADLCENLLRNSKFWLRSDKIVGHFA
jgi:hypothetical protein